MKSMIFLYLPLASASDCYYILGINREKQNVRQKYYE